MNKEEVKEIVVGFLIANGIPEDRAETFDGDEMTEYFGSEQTPYKGYTIKTTDEYGGEGLGDEYWYIFTLTSEDKKETHIKVEGWYDSWNGTSWEEYDFNIVESYIEPVTRWRNI